MTMKINSKTVYAATLAAAAFAVVGCVSIALWNPRPNVPPPPPQTPDLQNDVALQRTCADLFKNILKIQDDREEHRQTLNQVREAFNNSEVDRQSMTDANTLWLRNENALASEAAGLYSEGREKGCFQRVTQ